VQAEFVTGPELEADLDALVELEAQCCAFLSLTVACGDDATVLEVTGAPEAQSLIAELFGTVTPALGDPVTFSPD
jgi:hypothetical protein